MKTTEPNELGQPMGRLLAIDTSTSSMTAAVLEDGRLLKEFNSHAERNHSMYLLPAVQEALRELGLAPRDLDGIAVGRGPGSYTGVRIGVTVAKTMAWALKLPVFGVSSLEAMAAGGWAAFSLTEDFRSCEKKSGTSPASATVWLVPMMNARRGQVYTGLYALPFSSPSGGKGPLFPVDASGWMKVRDDGIRPLDRWLDELLRLADDSRTITLFVGETEGFEPLIERFQEDSEGTTMLMPYRLQARFVGMLGYKLRLSGETINPHLLLPNYTQLAEAEVKLLGKSQQHL